MVEADAFQSEGQMRIPKYLLVEKCEVIATFGVIVYVKYIFGLTRMSTGWFRPVGELQKS